MPRTREQIEQAAAEAEAWLNSIDPAEVTAEPTDDLQAIAVALRAVADADAALTDAVQAARDRGRSWGRIAIVLGISRESARDRYRRPATSPR